LCESIVLSGLDKDHAASLEMLFNALKITTSKIVAKNNTINCKQISKFKLSMNEYRILKELANVKVDLGLLQEVAEIHTAVITSLENQETLHDIKKKLLPTSYFNLSNLLLRQEAYNEALSISEQGLIFSRQYKEFKLLGELQCNMGIASQCLGDTKQAKLLLSQSYNTFISCGEDKLACLLKKAVKERYDIDIE